MTDFQNTIATDVITPLAAAKAIKAVHRADLGSDSCLGHRGSLLSSTVSPCRCMLAKNFTGFRGFVKGGIIITPCRVQACVLSSPTLGRENREDYKTPGYDHDILDDIARA